MVHCGAGNLVVRFAAGALCVLSATATRAETPTPCVSPPIAQRQASASADQSQSSRMVTIASLNLAGQPRIADALEAWTQTREIDILLLQEVGHRSLDGEAFVAALSERLQFHAIYAPANLIGDTHTQGLAIVSRYPLDHVRVLPLTYHRLRFRSRCRIALVATVAIPAGPVDLVNLHLDTRINSKDRLAQLAPVLESVDSNVPQLIGGDFNTMNIRWFRTMWPLVFLQRQVAAVEARMASGGFRTPFKGDPATFKFLHLPFRLDWLYLKRLEPLEWAVDTIPLTDHRGVWARVSASSHTAGH